MTCISQTDGITGKAASTLACRVWTSPKLSVKTNMAVYIACVISTLLCGSEPWTTYAGQERRLNTFHLRSIRRILGICWQDKVTNAEYVVNIIDGTLVGWLCVQHHNANMSTSES